MIGRDFPAFLPTPGTPIGAVQPGSFAVLSFARAAAALSPYSQARGHDGSNQRTASGVWRGDLKTGSGAITATSGVLRDTPFSYATRFENARGTT
jgi:osmotically inducible protein OsmC